MVENKQITQATGRTGLAFHKSRVHGLSGDYVKRVGCIMLPRTRIRAPACIIGAAGRSWED